MRPIKFLNVFLNIVIDCRREFFKSAGEVVDVRFASDPDGRFRGYGHVEFETHEAAKKVKCF